MATTMSSGPFDELIALHLEVGIGEALDAVAVQRTRAGLPDAVRLRTLATLPFVREASRSGAAGALFREPAVLLQLGWVPAQVRAGCNRRHRHPAGRQPEALPCHGDTLRDTLRRVSVAAEERAQRAGVRALYRHRLVRGTGYAIDGTSWGTASRLVGLEGVSGPRPVLGACRLLAGAASAQGKEAAVTHTLGEQAREWGRSAGIGWRRAEALSMDGPRLAGLQYTQGIAVLGPGPADRRLSAPWPERARAGWIPGSEHSYGRTLPGHQGRRTVAVAAAEGLRTGASCGAAAAAGARRKCPGGRLDPRSRPARPAERRRLGAAEHAAVAQGLRRPPGVPPALAHGG